MADHTVNCEEMENLSGTGCEVLCIGQAVIDCITRGQEADRHRENVFRAERIELHIGGDQGVNISAVSRRSPAGSAWTRREISCARSWSCGG